MDDFTPKPPKNQKQLAAIGRVGPAFSVNDVAAAHSALDSAGVPRKHGEQALSLTERIHWLHGQLISARMAKAMVICARPQGKRSA